LGLPEVGSGVRVQSYQPGSGKDQARCWCPVSAVGQTGWEQPHLLLVMQHVRGQKLPGYLTLWRFTGRGGCGRPRGLVRIKQGRLGRSRNRHAQKPGGD